MRSRDLVRRIRYALFGRPLTHEEAKARHEAEIANMRAGGEAGNRARASSVQSQLGMF